VLQLLSEQTEIDGLGDTRIAAALKDALLIRNHGLGRHREFQQNGMRQATTLPPAH
jgi:hypothetical protein